ncbi:MAG TPA: hypothetical protein VGQ52_04960 [Gemmatimonadaceae bacterium]|jgi:hypothetical protein|nr:hypothetical protein [Gemmatimonadaceae bacterium]
MAKASAERGTSTLELEEDREFEKRERLVRRIGTWLLSAFLVAALAGLFGSGPLSDAAARSNDNAVGARYKRFTRNRSTTALDLSLHAVAGQVQLGLNSAFVETIKVEQITPQPATISASRARHVYTFAAAGPDSIVSVVLRYRPETLGWLTAVVTSGQSELRIRQFVYP